MSCYFAGMKVLVIPAIDTDKSSFYLSISAGIHMIDDIIDLSFDTDESSSIGVFPALSWNFSFAA